MKAKNEAGSFGGGGPSRQAGGQGDERGGERGQKGRAELEQSCGSRLPGRGLMNDDGWERVGMGYEC